MSLWKELYDIIDKERSRWLHSSSSKTSLSFEIKTNLKFMMDALEAGVDNQAIVKGFETQAFEHALASGFEMNKMQAGQLTRQTIGKHKEFSKFLKKDSDFLIHHLYSKIKSLQKVALAVEQNTSALPKSTNLKFKSLFRFLVLVVAFLDDKKLGQ